MVDKTNFLEKTVVIQNIDLEKGPNNNEFIE